MAILQNEPAVDNNGNIIDFPVNDDTSLSFAYKNVIAGQEMIAQKY